MGIFTNKTNEQLDKLTKQVNSLSKTVKQAQNNAQETNENVWMSIADINRKINIEAANTAMNALKGTSENANVAFHQLKQTLDESIQYQIWNNQVPAELSWDYWMYINQWADYWVNRYNGFEHPKKANILNAIALCVLFGIAGLEKDTLEPLYLSKGKDGNWIGYKAQYAFSQDFAVIKDKVVSVNEAYEAVGQVYTREQLATIFTWRRSGLGDYVVMMKDILWDIYCQRIIQLNANNLMTKPLFKIKNFDTIIPEVKTLTNPLIPVGFLISDDQTNDASLSLFNQLMEVKPALAESHTEELIMTHKFHREQYYTQFGRMITSSKQQSLSSDANLSVYGSELVAMEHDWRMEVAFKELGITLKINEMDEMEPQNQNADKEGEGIEKTNGGKLNE